MALRLLTLKDLSSPTHHTTAPSPKSILEKPLSKGEQHQLKKAESSSQKAINSLIKARTQTLQQAVLDGFLGIDDSDKYRITRLIRQLIDKKPDVALRLLAKMLPTMSDADLQKQIPQQQVGITIINSASSQNSPSPSPILNATNLSPNQINQILDVEPIDPEEADTDDNNINLNTIGDSL